MSIDLRAQERVLYPVPYVETEPNLLLVTTHRVVHFGHEGRRELEGRDLLSVARLVERPFVALGVVLAILALIAMGGGIYLFASTMSMPAGLPTELPTKMPSKDDLAKSAKDKAAKEAKAAAAGEDLDDPAGAAEAESEDEGSGLSPTTSRIAGAAMVVTSLVLLGVGALLGWRRRFIVLLRGSAEMLQLRLGTESEQMQVLATVQALQSSAKGSAAGAAGPASAMAAMVSAPKPAAASSGDPHKALQELSTQRAAGKISEDEFYAKREVLLGQLRR